MIKKFIRLFLRKRLFNVNNTRHAKRVLICYTTKPFGKRQSVTHTNIQESKIISEVFNEFGFNVDIVDYDFNGAINYEDYDVIFGFGNVYQKSFFTNKKMLRIFYATGAYAYYQNVAEARRVIDFNNRHQVSLSPKRLIPWDWSLAMTLSESIIVIGNEWTKSTYEDNLKEQDSIYPINATAIKYDHEIVKYKSGSHYLWLGSAGLIHKGLDLCLDFFAQNRDITLHICGPTEKEFIDIYKRELDLPNINFHGFVTIGSKAFGDIVNLCSFTLMPTCSEGQSTALLTSMAYGLIPIATKESGVDVAETGGILIENLTQESLYEAIEVSKNIPNAMLVERSNDLIRYISSEHGTKNFKDSISKILAKIISESSWIK